MTTEVEEQIALAESNRSKKNYIILVYIVIGLPIAAVILNFIGFDYIYYVFWALISLSVTLGLWHAKNLPHAKCPKCGYDWEIIESKEPVAGQPQPSVDLTPSEENMRKWAEEQLKRSKLNMLNWKNCPGCGLSMRP